MNRFVRTFALAGAGLLASVTVGAGPAAAAPATFELDNQVVDIFDTSFECHEVGTDGEEFGRWDGYTCFPINGEWTLVVEDDADETWPGDEWPGGWPGRHDDWPGGGLDWDDVRDLDDDSPGYLALSKPDPDADADVVTDKDKVKDDKKKDKKKDKNKNKDDGYNR